MEIGGIMVNAYYLVLGNPAVMIALISFAVITTLLLATIELFNKFEGV